MSASFWRSRKQAGVSRFDVRRNLLVDEVNAIGGAYLRIDLLPADSQPALRESFRRYVDSRIAVYRDFEDLAAVDAALEANAKLQSEIWTEATAATARSDSAKILMVPALGQMLDVAASRTAATNNHPPPIVFIMLFSLALIGAMLAGYGTARAKSRDWVHMLAFAAVTSLTFYVIVDIEYPRLGLIRVSGADRALIALRESMN